MTSIISPFLLCICTALLSPLFCCHPLCLPVSNHFPFYLHPSVYLSIIFFSIPLSFFEPFSFILLFQLTCLFRVSLSTPDLSFPPVLLIHLKPSPPPLCFLCSILPLLPAAPLPLCCPCMFKFPTLVIALRLVLEGLRRDLARWRPSVSRSDKAECGCNTGSGHWHWHSPVSGYGSATRQPNRQPAFTLCL